MFEKMSQKNEHALIAVNPSVQIK